LHFVISDPDDEGKVLVVNMTSDDGTHDRTCVLVVGDHIEVKHQSVINYIDAINPELNKVQEVVNNDLVDEKNPISKELLVKIQEGAKKSPHLPNKYHKYFNLF